MADLGSLIVRLGVDTSGLMTARVTVQKFGKEAQAAMSNLQKTTSRLDSILGRAGMAFRSFGWLSTTVLTAPILMAGKTVLTTYSNFEFAMMKIVGLVGIARKEVDAWSTSVLQMSKSIGRSPQELADALYFVTSSGYKTSQALGIVEQSAHAASAGLGETKDVADLVTSVMNAYGQGNIGVVKTLDILTAAVREGKGEASQYAKVLGSVVPFAAQLGVTFDEVAGATAAMTLSGASAANAATYLRNIFMKLLKPAKQSEDALRAMGSSTAELRRILGEQGLMPALTKIRELTNRYGEDMMGLVIPNIRAMLAELMLTGKNFEYNIQVMDAVRNSTGSLAKAYQAVYETTKNKLARASASAQTSMIQLGEAVKTSVMPILEDLVKKLESLTMWFTNLSDGEQRALLKTLAFLAVLGPGSLIVSTFFMGMKGLATSISWLIKAFATLNTVTSVKTFANMRKMITTFGGAAKAVAKFRAILTGPWGMAAGAILGIVTAITKYEKGVKRAQIESSSLNTTLIDVNGEIKKLKDLKAPDFSTMNVDQLIKWNKWIQDSKTSITDWVTYFYSQRDKLSQEEIIQNVKIVTNWDESTPNQQKAAERAAGKFWDVIDIRRQQLADLKVIDREYGKAADDYYTMWTESSKYGAPPSDGTKPLFDAQASINLMNNELSQVENLQKAYKKFGLSSKEFDANAEKLKIYTEYFKTFAEEGFAGHPIVAIMAAEIKRLGGNLAGAQKAVSEFAASLKFIELKAKVIGPSFAASSEKLKLFTNLLDTFLEGAAQSKDVKGFSLKFIKENKIDLKDVFGDKMPENYDEFVLGLKKHIESLQATAAADEAFYDLGEALRIIALRSVGAGEEFNAATARLEAFSKVYDDFIKGVASSGTEGADAFATEFAKKLGPDVFNMDGIKTAEDVAKQFVTILRELSSAVSDVDIAQSIKMLEDETKAFGGLEIELELVSRRIQQIKGALLKEVKRPGGGTDTDEYKKQMELYLKYMQEQISLQNAFNVQPVQAMYDAFGGLGNRIELITANVAAARERFLMFFSLMQAGVPGANIGFAKATEDLQLWMIEAEKATRLAQIYQTLGNSIADFSSLIGEAFGGSEDAMQRMVGVVLSTAQQIIGALLAEAAAALLAGETIKGMGLPGLIVGMVAVGALMAAWQNTKSQTETAGNFAKGGVIPEGYPNDSFPAMLTSGEMIIPRDKYKDIDPLNKLAKKGKVRYSEFMDSPILSEKTKKIELPKFATGGIIPAGFPNDSYPALLTSGETVIPKGKKLDFSGMAFGFKAMQEGMSGFLTQSQTTGEKLHNFFADLGTGVSQLLAFPLTGRLFPTEEEYTRGRGEFTSQVSLLMDNTRKGLEGSLVGEAIPVGMGMAGKAVKNMQFKPKTPIAHEYFNPSKMLSDILSTGGKDVGISESYKDVITQGNKWLEGWFAHSETQARFSNVYAKNLSTQGTGESQYAWRELMARSQDPQSTKVAAIDFKDIKSILNYDGIESLKNSKGISGPILKETNEYEATVNPLLSLLDKLEEVLSTTVHEGAHKFTLGNTLIPEEIQNSLSASMKRTGGLKPEYYRKPTEVYARMFEMRKYTNVKPGNEFTLRDVSKILEHIKEGSTPINREFGYQVADKNLLTDLLNNLPVTAGVTAGGLALSSSNASAAGIEEGNKAAKKYPDVFKIMDARTQDKITGQPVSSYSKLNGTFDLSFLEEVVHKALERGIDPYTALAIPHQETGGTPSGSANPYAINYTDPAQLEKLIADPIGASLDILKAKLKLADKLGYDTYAKMVQVYNGMGTLTQGAVRGTKAYGVEIPEKGISMKETPLYGMRVEDVRNNILMQNEELVAFVENLMKEYPTPTMPSSLYKQAETPIEYAQIIPTDTSTSIDAAVESFRKLIEVLSNVKLASDASSIAAAAQVTATDAAVIATDANTDATKATEVVQTVTGVAKTPKAKGDVIANSVAGGVENVVGTVIQGGDVGAAAVGATGDILTTLFSLIPGIGPLLGPILGGLFGGLFKGAAGKMAKGGIIPAGFPNDTYPALLSTGETVLPREYKDMPDMLTHLTKQGLVPNGSISDELQLLLSTYEIQFPEEQFKSMLSPLLKQRPVAIDKSFDTKKKLTSRIYNTNNYTNNLTKINKEQALKNTNLTKQLRAMSKTVPEGSLKGSDLIKKLGKVQKGTPNDTFNQMKMLKKLGKDNAFGVKTTQNLKIKDTSADSINKLTRVLKESKMAEKLLSGTKYYSNIAKMAGGGAIPEGFPNDSFPAMLSSGEFVLPKNVMSNMGNLTQKPQKMHVTIDGKILGKDIVLSLRRASVTN